MGKPWVPYVVQQGDHLDKLAFRFGADGDTIWSNAKNKDLAGRRANRDTLCPGDVLWVPADPPPALPLSAGTTNSFTGSVPTIPVRLHLDAGRRPVAGKRFEVDGTGSAEGAHGTVSDQGEISFEVPIWVREVVVRIPAVGMKIPLLVGDLDPIEEASGVTQRLRNLGYLPASGAVNEEALHQAIRAFQKKNGLEPDGSLTEATRAALRDAHKS